MSDLGRLHVSRALPDSVMAAARARFEVTLRDTTQPMDPDEVAEALATHDVLLPTLGDPLGAGAYGGTIRAKGLANFGVGYNHIDVAAARAAGLVVTNTPGAVTDATADIALTLILTTARRAGEGERLVRAGRWQGWHPTQMLGMHVTGRTVGIVGMGRIGQAIADRCRLGFGMEVLFHNRSPKTIEGVTQVDDLHDLCARVDILVMAVAASPETANLLDAAALAALRPHAIVVNIARGDVVDEPALIEALTEGRIAGAGLDVYAQEPHVPGALAALENVVLLPHLGTAALEVREAMGRMALDNAIAIAEGRAPPNPV